MKKFIKGKFNNKGETLAETLVAILISVLALTLLASMIVSGNKVTAQSKEKMNAYYSPSGHTVQEEEGYISVTNSTGAPCNLIPGTSQIEVDFNINNQFSSTPVISYGE